MPLLWHTQRTLPTNDSMAIGAKGLPARTHGPKDRAAHKQNYAVAEEGKGAKFQTCNHKG